MFSPLLQAEPVQGTASSPVARPETGADPSWWPIIGILVWIGAAIAVGIHASGNDSPEILWALIVFISGPLGVLLYLAVVVYG